MKISDNKTINDLQKEFSEIYPGLKLEFYTSEHEVHEATSRSKLISNNITLGSIRNEHAAGDIEIAPSMTVEQIETKMKSIYDLNVQVFRRSSDLWLQTTATDDWTIEKQNQRGLNSIDPDIKLYDKP